MPCIFSFLLWVCNRLKNSMHFEAQKTRFFQPFFLRFLCLRCSCVPVCGLAANCTRKGVLALFSLVEPDAAHRAFQRREYVVGVKVAVPWRFVARSARIVNLCYQHVGVQHILVVVRGYGVGRTEKGVLIVAAIAIYYRPVLQGELALAQAVTMRTTSLFFHTRSIVIYPFLARTSDSLPFTCIW